MVASEKAPAYSSLINLAGTPPTTVRGATSRVTTAPAATTAPSPMVTPGSTVTFDPSHASAPMRTGRGNQIRTLGRIHVVVQRGDDAIVPDERAVADVYAALVLEAAAGVEEHALAQVRVQPAVGRERRKQPHALRKRAHEQPLELLARVG